MSEQAERVRITDPNFYIDNPYPVFARMRKDQPYYYEELDTFVITRYEDIRAISRDTDAWSTTQGILLNDVIYGDVAQSFFPDGVVVMTLSDAPVHHQLRKAISPAFTPRRMEAHRETVTSLVESVIDAIERDQPMEFVDQVSATVSLGVIAKFLGLPAADVPLFRVWTDDFVKQGSASTPEELAEAAGRSQQMFEYLEAQLHVKRANPDDGLVSLLANAEQGSKRLTDIQNVMLLMEVLTAGNITTRNLLSGTVLTIAQHPDQLRLLRADPTLSSQVVEEGLRWVSPVTGFLRTAKQPTSIGATPVQAGQHAYLLYMAGNRDESVFSDPETFDITRVPDPAHLAFGFGQHMCIGAPVARLEAQIVFESLIARFSRWDVAGDPTRAVTLLENGWTSLPMVFSA